MRIRNRQAFQKSLFEQRLAGEERRVVDRAVNVLWYRRDERCRAFHVAAIEREVHLFRRDLRANAWRPCRRFALEIGEQAFRGLRVACLLPSSRDQASARAAWRARLRPRCNAASRAAVNSRRRAAP